MGGDWPGRGGAGAVGRGGACWEGDVVLFGGLLLNPPEPKRLMMSYGGWEGCVEGGVCGVWGGRCGVGCNNNSRGGKSVRR